MLIRRTLVVGVGMLAATWTHAPNARACTCDVPLSVVQEFERSDAVFLGEVLDHSLAGNHRRIHVGVVQSWKGVTTHYACVNSPPNSASCGIVPEIGEQLLIYAQGAPSALWTHSCTRTGQYHGALQDIDTLAALGYEPIELDGPGPGNFDGDGFLGLVDFAEVADCLTGPCDGVLCEPRLYADPCCAIADSDDDGDVDLEDVAAFQSAY